MINDRPTNISLNTGSIPEKQVAVPKGGEVKNKETVDAQPNQPLVQPEVDEPSKAEVAQKQIADTIESEARREELKQRVNEAIPKVRELMNKNQRSLDFKVAEKDNRIIVTVIDKETDKVIRQIPPEDLLHIADSIDEGVSTLKEGSIINSKA
ncbi:MAG: flagellar protein FlaG [Pseudomonadota bacterium]|nr:flagellar protein FlaG [Pseudomonadota bacterium]